MRLHLVRYESISDNLQAIFSSIELNGPAIFCDSAASMLATALKVRSSENPATFKFASDRVLDWLFSHWRPSKLVVTRASMNLTSFQAVSTIAPTTCRFYSTPAYGIPCGSYAHVPIVTAPGINTLCLYPLGPLLGLVLKLRRGEKWNLTYFCLTSLPSHVAQKSAAAIRTDY